MVQARRSSGRRAAALLGQARETGYEAGAAGDLGGGHVVGVQVDGVVGQDDLRGVLAQERRELLRGLDRRAEPAVGQAQAAAPGEAQLFARGLGLARAKCWSSSTTKFGLEPAYEPTPHDCHRRTDVVDHRLRQQHRPTNCFD